MPSKSKSQHNYWEGVLHGAIKGDKKVARKFVDADKGKDLKGLPKHVKEKGKDTDKDMKQDMKGMKKGMKKSMKKGMRGK